MADLQKLVLLGIGANNSDVFDAVCAINRVRPTFEVVGRHERERGERRFVGTTMLDRGRGRDPTRRART